MRELFRQLIHWKNRLIRLLTRWAKHTSLPGFFKIPIWDIMVFLIGELKKEDIVTRSESMAFSFFLSLFPAIIFMFTLIPYLPVEDIDSVIRTAIHEVMPDNAHAFLFETVDSITSIPRGGLLSLGFILALIFASSGLTTMIRGFEKSYSVSFKERSFIRKRGIALGLTLFVGLCFILSGVIVVAGNRILGLIFDEDADSWTTVFLFGSIKWLAILFLFYSVISVNYKFGPALKKRIALISPGTTMATVGTLLTSILFSYVIDSFGTTNRIYGPLGSLIIMLVWMQINCFILLAGYELNASIAINRDLRTAKILTEKKKKNAKIDPSAIKKRGPGRPSES